MTRHKPVMLREAVSKLALSSGDCVFDGTVGSAGHTRAICARLDFGRIVGTDKDRQAIQEARKTLEKSQCSLNYCLRIANFQGVETIMKACGVEKFQAALLDLGFRSEQLESERGFSFQHEAPLLMTYKDPDTLTKHDVTARDVVNTWDKQTLVDILSGYADETHAQEIAKEIVSRRQSGWLETTTDLVEAVKTAVPSGYARGGRHPATKTFQAIRMAVNDEVRSLTYGLKDIFTALSATARFVVISFHSVEDRIVKRAFSQWVEAGKALSIGNQPITPQQPEIDTNPRARSAKLRCIEKVQNSTSNRN
ncbi:MAG: 16S rRNA (cytosine(1402)-N(4))-methyltransferase [Parcubacteria group bacterium SW_6_46_9]|nr:MAG: 16S rRNA (cytosine(1402)-N(4))-methyltransferase [Parcubacteria group bacterium SW_6_46_9]